MKDATSNDTHPSATHPPRRRLMTRLAKAAGILAMVFLIFCIGLIILLPEPKPEDFDPDAWMHIPPDTIIPDNRPPIAFDVGKPYRLAFGRGSGWHGLDTVVVDEAGEVVLHRMTYESVDGVRRVYWERGTLNLQPGTMEGVAVAIRDLHLLGMNRAYHADVYDGAQWIFRLVQGGQEKAIYFNNHFPVPIRRFAVILDDILKDAGIDAVTWSRVPGNVPERQHERTLWDVIKE